MFLPLCWIIGRHRTHPPITGLLPSTGIKPTTFRNLENRHLFRTPVEHRSHDISHSKWNFLQMQITAKKWLTILAKSSTIVISEVSKYVPEKTYSKNCKRKQNLQTMKTLYLHGRYPTDVCGATGSYMKDKFSHLTK